MHALGLDHLNKQRVLREDWAKLKRTAACLISPWKRGNDREPVSRKRLFIEGCVTAPNPSPNRGVNIQVGNSTDAWRYMADPQSAVLGIAWRAAIHGTDQLPKILIVPRVLLVAGLMRSQFERQPITFSKDSLRRNVIVVALIARRKLLSTNITEGKVTNVPEVRLSR